jgi:hypothetical protein
MAGNGVPRLLTWRLAPANMRDMAYSFLIFDFGRSEDAAQKARHRIEGWKQGFRLDKKLQLKFERQEEEAKADASPAASKPKPAKSDSKAKAKQKTKSKAEEESGTKTDSSPAESADIRLIVRLDFSDHEKLSHQRWLDRIPTEEPFNEASPKIVRTGDPEFQKVSDLFDSLD